jgi:T4 superinfection immunity protein
MSDAIAGFAVLAILLAVCFAPTLIAATRHHRQVGPIAVINVLLGWTLVGWVVAFVMAVSYQPRRAR